VLLDDLDLPVLPALHDGRVVGVDEARLGVQEVHGLVVGQGVVDVAVDARVREERVDGHGSLL